MSNSEVLEMDGDGNVSPPAERRGAGRPPGSKNNPLKTKAFAEWVNDFLERKFDKIEQWIEETANGKPTQVLEPDPATGFPGGIIQGTDPDPGKAVDLVLKLAEFGAPKQGRVVVANDPENPFMQPVLNVTIGGKKVEYTQGSTTPRDVSSD